MSNSSELKNKICHSNPLSKFKADDKYNAFYDSSFLKGMTDNLWYTFNNESLQLPYCHKQLIPKYLTDSSLDTMMQWKLMLLLKIKPSNFIMKKIKKDTINAIDSLSDFYQCNSLVMYYEKSPKSTSFIIKFLQGFRNSLAHGGFNKLFFSTAIHDYFISCNNLDNCLNNGFQLAMHLVYNDSTSSNNIFDVIKEITNCRILNAMDFFKNNLMLSGYNVIDCLINKVTYNGQNKTIYEFKVSKNNIEKQIFYINGSDAEEKKEIISQLILKHSGIALLSFIKQSTFYLADEYPSFKLDAFERDCVCKIFSMKSNTEAQSYILKNSFHLNVVQKDEFYNLL